MAKHSNARAALRSYFPKSYLAGRRDAAALVQKYRAQLHGSSERLLTIGYPGYWFVPPLLEDLDTYHPSVRLGGMRVEGESLLQITGVHSQSNSILRCNYMDATLLHIEELHGAGHFKQQLGRAAAYINTHDALKRAPYVAGITYREMARLAVRVGFDELNIVHAEPHYQAEVHANHMAYCALNGVQRPFELAAVFLPTHEFINRFDPPEGRELPVSS